MLGTASHTLESLAKQAETLQAQVQAAEKEKAQKMAKQKASFEAKLKAQELGNRALVSQNQQTSQQIEVLKKGNAELRTQSQALESTNAVMRDELSALQGRLGTAQGYVAKALQKTDDSGAKDLLVLEKDSHAAVVPGVAPAEPAVAAAAAAPEPPAAATTKHGSAVGSLAAAASGAGAAHGAAEADKDTDEDGVDDEDGDDDEKPTSLLVIGEERRVEAVGNVTPEEAESRSMIKVLKQSVSQLSAQEQASEAQLKALFTRSFKAGKQRHQSLVATQQALNTSRAEQLDLQGRLQTARSHLQATQQSLHQRLSKLGGFLQKLAHLALAPTSEAPRLEKALPGAPDATPAPVVAVAVPADDTQ